MEISFVLCQQRAMKKAMSPCWSVKASLQRLNPALPWSCKPPFCYDIARNVASDCKIKRSQSRFDPTRFKQENWIAFWTHFQISIALSLFWAYLLSFIYNCTHHPCEARTRCLAEAGLQWRLTYLTCDPWREQICGEFFSALHLDLQLQRTIKQVGFFCVFSAQQNWVDSSFWDVVEMSQLSFLRGGWLHSSSAREGSRKVHSCSVCIPPLPLVVHTMASYSRWLHHVGRGDSCPPH